MTGKATAEQVHQALLHLYSPGELAKSELASLLPECQGVADLVQRAQLVRNLLLDMAQSLRPANRLATAATAARAHSCLMLRYVSGQSIVEVAAELSLSSRQVYRDLRWAEELLAELLNSRPGPEPAMPLASTDALALEMEDIAHKPERLSMVELLHASLAAVRPLAERRGVGLIFNFNEPSGDWHVTATPGILQQVITQLLSSIAQSIDAGEIAADLVREGGAGVLHLRFGQVERLQRPDLFESALRIARSQGLNPRFRQDGDSASLALTLPIAARHRVLVVEDSPGACALYERYLENTEFEATVAADPGDAREMVAAGDFHAVILDIMMPALDGWTVLQSLKLDPETRGIPVVICSVIADRELGGTLGAAGYLTKPVSRSEFLSCLRRFLPEAPSFQSPRRTSA